MARYNKAMLISSTKVAVDTYEMVLDMESAKRDAIPGQFVHVQIPNRPDMLTRRPISINSIDTSSGTMTLIVQAKKEGTKVLCEQPPNTILDVIGPVGRGFMLHKDVKKVAIVGGGIGVAPLRYLIERNPQIEFYSFIGYRSKKFAYQVPIFKEISTLYLHTDDGTAGRKGFATDTLEKMMQTEHFDAICACGPVPMFKSLEKVVSKYEVSCYISLEERMGCGIGACKVCVCETKAHGEKDYKTVCGDGPVFDIKEVVL